METEDLEAWDQNIPVPYVESGSDYEEGSNAEDNGSSQDDERIATGTSRANSTSEGGRSKSGRRQALSSDQEGSQSDSEVSRDSSTGSRREARRRDAVAWAATFLPPQSAADVKSPDRKTTGSRSKRKAAKPPSEMRAKRLKSWYNNEYRELLNTDIHDAAARSIGEDQVQLRGTQIGCSIWTSKEKDLFFSSLSRLGRDNVAEIASRVGSKSDVEVREYITLLHHGTLAHQEKLHDITHLPAAVEVSEECSGLLERAGDALNSRQEQYEEEAEREKWGETWLIDKAACKRFEVQQKSAAGKYGLEEEFPPATFFHLKIWLELSRRIFMNPESVEENWEAMAESGETPAIRAMAVDDLYSLTSSITRRIVATTIFCTTSRQRATGAKPLKHAEINLDDVEAAVKTLGLTPNSHEFWKKCARRGKLKVIDEQWNSFMSYDEVEEALEERRERSRSRSVSRQRSLSRAATSEGETELPSDSASGFGSDESLGGYQFDMTDGTYGFDLGGLEEGDELTSRSRKERILERARAKKEAEHAYENYVDAFDQEASRGEEVRLWTLLKQKPPFDLKTDAIDLPERPEGLFKDDYTETMNWRDHVLYEAPWETLEMPVSREEFERNRKRISQRAKRRLERPYVERHTTSESSEDEEDAGSNSNSEEDGREEYENALETIGEELDDQYDDTREIWHNATADTEDEHEVAEQRRPSIEDDEEYEHQDHDEASDNGATDDELQPKAEDASSEGSNEEEKQSPMSIEASIDVQDEHETKEQQRQSIVGSDEHNDHDNQFLDHRAQRSVSESRAAGGSEEEREQSPMSLDAAIAFLGRDFE